MRLIVKEIIIPELAETITEGTIAEWLVKPGDAVKQGDPVVELETDKVNVEVNSEFTGVLSEILHDEGEDVEVGDAIGKIDENAEAGETESKETETKEESKAETEQPKEEPKAPAASEEKEEEEEVSSDDGFVASPAARKRARELNIDLSKVTANDPLGRIRPEDVDAAAKAPEKAPQSSAPAKEEEEFAKPTKREKMSRRRQTIAKRLVEAQQTAAMLTTFNEVDMSAVMNLRKERQEQFVAKNDMKLGFMSFFAKASVAALKEFPHLNAEIDGTDLLLKEYYDIGIAVGVAGGLVVPVIRDVDELDFAEIEKEVKDLGGKAQNNSLSLDE